MIPYSLDNNNRKNVIVIIVIISIFLTIIIDNVFVNLALLQNLKSSIESIHPYGNFIMGVMNLLLQFTIPVFTVWFILYKLFVEVLWKNKLLYSIHHVPDLNGIWHGEVLKKNKNGEWIQHRQVEVTITQDWEKIRVKTRMKDSDMPSFCTCTVAAIDSRKDTLMLKYAYRNNAVNSNYVGYNELTIENDKIYGAYITTKPSNGRFIINRA